MATRARAPGGRAGGLTAIAGRDYAHAMKGVLAAALCAALLAGGCGESDEDQVRGVMEDWFAALADRDDEKVCSLMSDKTKQALSPFDDCEEWARSFASAGHDEGYDFDSVEIDRVDVEGDEATVGIKDDTSTFDLRKIDGEWLIDDNL